ncbi:unnamed protein product [Caenorhabditis brenneri]
MDLIGSVELLELSSEEMRNKVEEFLQLVEKTVATEKKYAISKLFRHDFIFTTCRMKINADIPQCSPMRQDRPFVFWIYLIMI